MRRCFGVIGPYMELGIGVHAAPTLAAHVSDNWGALRLEQEVFHRGTTYDVPAPNDPAKVRPPR